MTGMLLRVVIFVIIGLAIWLGIRKIWRDWSNQFKADDEVKFLEAATPWAFPIQFTLARTGLRPGEAAHAA